MGWNIVSVRDAIGTGKKDEAVIELAKKHNYVVVTPDRKLVKCCKLLHITVIELGVELFPDAINRQLIEEFPAEA